MKKKNKIIMLAYIAIFALGTPLMIYAQDKDQKKEMKHDQDQGIALTFYNQRTSRNFTVHFFVEVDGQFYRKVIAGNGVLTDKITIPAGTKELTIGTEID